MWPFGFLSNVVTSPATMPGWLGTIADANPGSATVAAVRDLCGNPGWPGTSWFAVHATPLAIARPLGAARDLLPTRRAPLPTAAVTPKSGWRAPPGLATIDAMSTKPVIGGVRRSWTELPDGLRTRIETDLGAPVTEAVTQPGGFSPGVAARLLLADGRRAFVKAVGAEPNPESPDIHRGEARIAAQLPAHAPVPRLLAAYDTDGWVALVFADIDGHLPAQPWRPDELDRVLAAMTDLAAALTPSTVDVPTFADRFREQFSGWRTIAADPALADRLDPRPRRHLHALAELEATAPAHEHGTTLLHADLRADNILLTADRVVFVDWPWACTGAPWLDLLCMLPSVAMHGRPDQERIFTGHPLGAAAPPDGVTAVLAGPAGFYIGQGSKPPPPGLPTLRRFQLAQGATALDWLRTRTGWR